MTKKIAHRFSPAVRQRAVQMVLEHGGSLRLQTNPRNAILT
jgi:transposase-like protein